jgi:hypothetical protein
MTIDLTQLSRHGTLAGALVVGTGCWLLLIRKIPPTVRSRQPARIMLCVAVAAVAIGLTVQIMAATIDEAADVPNLGRLMSNCAAMVSAWAAEFFTLYVAHGYQPGVERIRRRYAALVVLLAGVVILFTSTPPQWASSIADPRHDTTVYSSPYVYLYAAYLGGVLFASGWAIRRYVRTTRGLLRTSLFFGLVGCVAGVAYALSKVAYLLDHDLDIPMPGSEALVSRQLYVLATAGLLGAVAVPVVGAGVRRARRWAAHYRSYQRLFRLWLALYQANPRIAMDPRPSRLASLLTVRDLPFRLYRRVIEIRDGELALLPAGGARSGPPLPPPDPAGEAARVTAALRATPGTATTARTSRVTPMDGPVDLESEIRWLEQVSTAFRRQEREV